MQQTRVEPYVGTSSSSRAAPHDIGPSQPFDSESSDDQHTARFGCDAESTADISGDADSDSAFGEYAEADSAAADVQIGMRLRDRYVLHRLIGTGGTCRVFLSEDLHRRLAPEAAGELIAVKVLRPGLGDSAHSLQRLRREFLQMQQLTHPAITRVFDLDCDGDVWFMTMELVDAPSALTWMSGDYSNAEALRLILTCCEAVGYAHRKGIVHGDLKPGNVLVLADGHIKLIDFGSVAGKSEPASEVTKLEATPQYASPAVLAGNMAEVRDDVFSLGCLAYMILARGRHPFDRKPATEAAAAQLRAPYIPGVPVRVFEVVTRALAWDPAQRQASVRELHHALLASQLTRTQQPADADSSTVPSHAGEPQIEAADGKPAAPPPPNKEHSAGAPGDYSYLSKFRGYVAGPKMDVNLHRDAPEKAPHEPTQQIRLEPELEADTAAPAAVVAQHPPLYIPTPHAVATPQLAPTVVRDARMEHRPHPPSPTKRVLVNALGACLVLASAIVAALLSRPEQPQRQAQAAAALTVPPAIELPAITVPTPELEPMAMPRLRAPSPVRIAVTKLETPARRPDPVAAASPRATAERVSAARSTASRSNAPRSSTPRSSTRRSIANVTFDARTVKVSPNQRLVAIPVRRSNADRGAARVAWQIEGGRSRQLLDQERAGAQVIQFHVGQAQRTLYVPLRKEAGELAADGVRTFRVKLRQVANGPSPGNVAEVRVTLLD